MEWMTIDGFNEDTYFGSDDEASRPELTWQDLKDLEDLDRWIAQVAARQRPLDGCEEAGDDAGDDDNWIEDYAAQVAA